MQTSLCVRGKSIGEGRPKVIVPIVDCTAEAILNTAKTLSTLQLDCIEWRADFFEHALQQDALLALLQALRENIGNTPLLTTYRRQKEGGNGTASRDAYCNFCETVISSGYTDLIDIEYRTEDARAASLTAFARKHHVPVVQSYHDFAKTPPESEIIDTLLGMQNLGAHIAKIAVMPQNAQDVLTLLHATQTAHASSTIPLITMSMGEFGKASRICGGTFGSSMTFASVGTSSAPGQIPLDALNIALDALYGTREARTTF